MKRGDIYFASLDPTVGSEIKKMRPVLILSNNANNTFCETVTVIPLTSQVKHIYHFEVLLSAQDTHLDKDSKAQCHQIRTLLKKRFQSHRKGHVTQQLMKKIEDALKIHLGL